MLQVEHSHYLKPEFLSPERMASYSYQFSELYSLKPKTVLEIGLGQGILTFLMRKAGFSVDTYDFDPALKPDYTGDVRDMRIDGKTYDAVVCFQVLEHLPYDDFELCLKQIHNVTNGAVVLSLPHTSRWVQLGLSLPKCRAQYFMLPFNATFPKKHTFDGEHYWEIGKKHYPLNRILASITHSGFKCYKTYRVPQNPYHRMFVLRKS
jgi:2-polyprenyl-3-methyl-5-hydroxy-6-metoxy-1,4-benzoquinol methylase